VTPQRPRKPRPPPPPPARDPRFGCLLWRGRIDRDGYAQVEFRGPRGHLLAYAAARGPVPPDRVIDHLCRRRHCVEPTHLEAVTRGENELRKLWRYRCRRERCALGHALAGAVVTPEGGRLCRVCTRSVLSADPTVAQVGGR
jgi:hypothetical protein